MKENNFYADINECIEKYFNFLKKFGFSALEEKTVAFSRQLYTKNNFVNICFESKGFGTLVSITIDQYGLRILEPDNLILEEISARTDVILNELMLRHSNKEKHYNNREFEIELKELSWAWVIEMSEILKRNPSVLNGDTTLFEQNKNIFTERYELQKAANRIKNKTYTLEYQFFNNDEYDCFIEFSEIKEIKQYLSEQNEIIKYRVLDCNRNEIDLDL